MTEAAFDILAPLYDSNFSDGWVGTEQRGITQKLLLPFVPAGNPLTILEVNCGTGIDACWLASLGHRVIATDISAAMISEARERAGNRFPEFRVSGFSDLINDFEEARFDLIFSNFAGLNCLGKEELDTFLHDAAKLLKPGGRLAVVLFGKFCLWETLYFLLQGQASRAFRRWSPGGVEARLEQDHSLPVYYHRSTDLDGSGAFRLVKKKPVGLAIPPSYIGKLFDSRPNLRLLLSRLEKKLSFSAFSSFGDHSFYLLKKTV